MWVNGFDVKNKADFTVGGKRMTSTKKSLDKSIKHEGDVGGIY